jgi:hypothetical protein
VRWPAEEGATLGVERAALLRVVLLRLRKIVPRKMPTVTQRTPRFPHRMALQPFKSSEAETKHAVRNANITPPSSTRAIPRAQD